MKKLRAWDDVAKKLIYARFEQFDDMIGYQFDEHFETMNPVYMWCTEMNDKNGREMWEGDCITYAGREYVVVWDSGRFIAETIGGRWIQDLYEIREQCEVVD